MDINVSQEASPRAGESDRTFSNFRASKSANRRMFCSSKMLIDGSYGFNFVQCSVGNKWNWKSSAGFVMAAIKPIHDNLNEWASRPNFSQFQSLKIRGSTFSSIHKTRPRTDSGYVKSWKARSGFVFFCVCFPPFPVNVCLPDSEMSLASLKCQAFSLWRKCAST